MDHSPKPPAFTNPKKSPKKLLIIGGVIAALVIALLICLELLTWRGPNQHDYSVAQSTLRDTVKKYHALNDATDRYLSDAGEKQGLTDDKINFSDALSAYKNAEKKLIAEKALTSGELAEKAKDFAKKSDAYTSYMSSLTKPVPTIQKVPKDCDAPIAFILANNDDLDHLMAPYVAGGECQNDSKTLLSSSNHTVADLGKRIDANSKTIQKSLKALLAAHRSGGSSSQNGTIDTASQDTDSAVEDFWNMSTAGSDEATHLSDAFVSLTSALQSKS